MYGFENIQSRQINVRVTETPCMEWRVQQTEHQKSQAVRDQGQPLVSSVVTMAVVQNVRRPMMLVRPSKLGEGTVSLSKSAAGQGPLTVCQYCSS
jgi:hypothetical protein